jgi:hypothetical protein
VKPRWQYGKCFPFHECFHNGNGYVVCVNCGRWARLRGCGRYHCLILKVLITDFEESEIKNKAADKRKAEYKKETKPEKCKFSGMKKEDCHCCTKTKKVK